MPEGSRSNVGEYAESQSLDEMLKEQEIEGRELLMPRKIETVQDLVNFHLHLIELCVIYELKKKTIETSIKDLRGWITNTTPQLDEFEEPAKMLLGKINGEIDFEKGRLSVVKEFIQTIYFTNEYIITSLLYSSISRESLERMKEDAKGKNPDLLHNGGKGWMLEYECLKKYINEGKVAFMTFGTYLDPSGVDIICFPLLTLSTPVQLRDLIERENTN